MQNPNSAMTLVRPGPARLVETARQGLIARRGMAQFTRATWRAGRFHVIAVVVILFGWPVLLFLVFADSVLLAHGSERMRPMRAHIAAVGFATISASAAPNGWLAAWDGRDIEATIWGAVLILVSIALVFGCLMAILLKFWIGH